MDEGRYLVCDFNDDPIITIGIHTRSCIECFEEALRNSYHTIIVSLYDITLAQRCELVELCKALRRQKELKNTPILALMAVPQRNILEDLHADIGPIHVAFDPDHLTISENNLASSQVRRCCRYLGYIDYDESREMVVCRAYLSRLVLGKQKQIALCTTESHVKCEYYLHPRS